MSEHHHQPEDEVVCHCSGTKRSEIVSLFAQGKDQDAISRWTGAISGCGGCDWEIAEILRELAEQKQNHASTNGD